MADFLKSQHVEFSIYSDTPPARLHSAYDNVVCHKAQRSYTSWLKNVSSVVWTHVPKTEQINCAKSRGVVTTIVPMWQDLIQPFRKAIRTADHVVALTTECRELFKTIYKFKHVTLIPFDTGLPVVKKLSNINEKQVKIFLPWFDRNARCAHGDFLGHLGWLMERMPEASLTVAISSSRFAPAVAKFFQLLGTRTGGRVVLKRSVQINDRPALYTAHDITLLPAECDNYGLCSLTSVTCGTPVLAFAVSPQSDFIKSDTNGFLVKTTVNYDENGVPHADPDYEKLLSSLQTVVAEPWHINNLNKRTAHNLETRRKAFTLSWQTLLRLV
jgi:glycosyltransferase involved in cell wall biosynthesis